MHDQATASISSNCTSWTEARMVVVRSVSTVTWTDEGKRALQLRQQLLDAVDDFDDVGAGLALDVDDHRRRRRSSRPPAGVFHVVDDIGHVRQMDRRAVAIGDDRAADILVLGSS